MCIDLLSEFVSWNAWLQQQEMEFHFCPARAPRQLPWVGNVPTSRDERPSFGGAHPGAVLLAGRDEGLPVKKAMLSAVFPVQVGPWSHT